MGCLWVRICFVRFLLRGIRTSGRAGRGCTMHVARCTLHGGKTKDMHGAANAIHVVRSGRDKGLCEPRLSSDPFADSQSSVCSVCGCACVCMRVCVCLILSLSAAYPNANRFANVKAPATHDRRTQSSISRALSLHRGLGCHTMPVGSCKWLLLCTAIGAWCTVHLQRALFAKLLNNTRPSAGAANSYPSSALGALTSRLSALGSRLSALDPI